MLPSVEELKTHLDQRLPGISLSVDAGALIVAPADLLSVCRCLKDTEHFGMDYLSSLTAVDYLPAAPSSAQAGPPDSGHIDMVYHLYSMTHKHGPITIRVSLPRANPRVASLVPLWRGAEFQEREVYDLYGVVFEGHPDLRRILMWDGFEGHPMRKDYVPEDQNLPGERTIS